MISGIFWALWRRAYGEGALKKYGSRGILTVLAVAVLYFELVPTHPSAVQIVFAMVASGWVVLQYWSRSVGEIIDAGLNTQQTAKSYGRWFRVPLDWVYDKLGKQKYIGFYDFWYSCIRYGIGAAILLFYSSYSVALIPLHYPIYLGVHKLYETYPVMYKLGWTLNEPKNLAELIHGFLFGLIVGMM